MNNQQDSKIKRARWFLGTVLFIAAFLFLFKYKSDIWKVDFANTLPLFKRGLYILLVSTALCLYRVFRGPTSADRLVAIDILGVLIVGFCAILCITTGRSWYIDIGIAWGLQSFIGTLALAKHLEGRGLDE